MAQLNDLLVLGNTSLIGDVNLSSNLNVSETFSVAGAATIGGALTVSNAISATGNITGNYLTGTRLQTTASTEKTSATKLAMLDDAGWVYWIKPSNITAGAATKITVSASTSNGTKYLLFSESTSENINTKLHEDVYYYYGGTYSSLNVGKKTNNGILTLWKNGLNTDIKSTATAVREILLPDKSGTLAMQATWNDFIHSGNEFTFASPGYGSSSTDGAYIWLNYRTASGDSDGNINGYKFGNGKKTMEGVTVETFAFKGKKYRLTDKANNDYSALYDNGTNLWIGAESTAAKHHIGGTYISAGHSGTAGNSTIYISVPNAANNNGANYGVFHTGNYKDLIATNGLNAPIIITNTTSKPAAKTDLPILKVRYQNSGGSYYTADVISAIGTGETGTTVNNACIRMGSTSGSLALTAGECGKNMITKHSLINTENIYLLADADVQFYVGCANDAASSTNALNITSTKIEPKVNIVFSSDKGIVQHQNSGSNYTVPIKWLQGGVSEATYDPQIGHHNTGDTDGAIILLPYSTANSPWNGNDGLYIGKNSLKWNGYSVLTSKSTVTIAQGGTGATSASAARTNLGVPPTNHASTVTTYGVGNSTNYGHVILYNAADCTSYTSDSGGACTPAAVKKAVGLFDPKAHNHSASNITSGTLPIARGGTGATSVAGILANLGLNSVADISKYNQHWWKRTVKTPEFGYKEVKEVIYNYDDDDGRRWNLPYYIHYNAYETNEIKYADSINIDQITGEITLNNPSIVNFPSPRRITSLSQLQSLMNPLKGKYISGGKYSTYNGSIVERQSICYIDPNATLTYNYSDDMGYYYYCAFAAGSAYKIIAQIFNYEPGNTDFVWSNNINAYSNDNNYTYEYLGIPFEKLPVASSIETGIYYGTGAYGEDNKNILTFTRQPKLVLISQFGVADFMYAFLRDVNTYSLVSPGTTIWGSAIADWEEENTLKWYFSGGMDTTHQNLVCQANVDREKYYFIAFF